MTNDTVNDSIKWTKWNYIALKHNHCYAIMQVTSFPLFFLWGDRGSRGWYDNPQTALRPLLKHGPLCNPGVCKLSACECCAALSRDRHIMCIESLVLYVHSFYRAAYMQGGLSHCKGVCPSVRPSVTRVNCDKTNESSAEILIPGGSLLPKISRRRGHLPPTISTQMGRPVNALQLCRWQFSHKQTLQQTFFQRSRFFIRRRQNCRLWGLLGGLGATYAVHLRLIGKLV